VLHFAAEKGSADLVSLLLESSCDPTVKSLYSSKTPSDMASSTEIRNIFRKYYLSLSLNHSNKNARYAGSHPDKWDYKLANIVPLTQEMEEEMKVRQADRKKKKRDQAKKKKQEQEKQKKVEEQQKKEEEAKRKIEEAKEKEIKQVIAQREKEMAQVKNLSEREKRALAAEKRLVASTTPSSASSTSSPLCWKCDFCQKESGINVSPFTRFNWKYCSVACVKAHKGQTG